MAEQITVSCGECRSAHGTLAKNLTDQLLGRPAKLVIDWTFARP